MATGSGPTSTVCAGSSFKSRVNSISIQSARSRGQSGSRSRKASRSKSIGTWRLTVASSRERSACFRCAARVSRSLPGTSARFS